MVQQRCENCMDVRCEVEGLGVESKCSWVFGVHFSFVYVLVTGPVTGCFSFVYICVNSAAEMFYNAQTLNSLWSPSLLGCGTSSHHLSQSELMTLRRRDRSHATPARWSRCVSFPDLCCVAYLFPHLRCDVGMVEGKYCKKNNCLCVTVLCTVIMVHKGTSSS